MPTFKTERIVRFTPQQMFDLVADVERYPEFLPLCESLTVRKREPLGGQDERIIARMTAAYGPVRESFTTQVDLARERHAIDVRYLEGPFRHLQNTWGFLPRGQGCAVQFFIDYEFRSRTLQLLMGAMFDRAFRKFADAFEARAERVYGAGAG